ncbi:glycine cleavage system protein GcvH [Eubacteriales bacterium OttesenSCG-928-A19]|nr:glycine cleavage system protein GcvH [Eubacteriales bacterium OttesenSCG-928-A19]
MVPNDRRYTNTHEWIMLDGGTATIGLTDYAQHELGDIVYVELPQVGERIAAGGRLAVVESVKAASDVFVAVGGEVSEANAALEDAPERINEEPWTAWIARLKVENVDESALLDAVAYEAIVAAEEAKA